MNVARSSGFMAAERGFLFQTSTPRGAFRKHRSLNIECPDPSRVASAKTRRRVQKIAKAWQLPAARNGAAVAFFPGVGTSSHTRVDKVGRSSQSAHIHAATARGQS